MRCFCPFLAALTATFWLPSFHETTFARADEEAFAPGEVVRAFTNLLQRESLGRKRLDGRMSARWLGAFLDRLDPKRMYFLQADEAEFRRTEGRLGDLARAGDFGFPQSVRERYARRVGEAASCAAQSLSLHHDYSVDEEFPIRFATYAADARELRGRWRLRIKFELLLEKTHGVSLRDAETQLRSRYARIARQARGMNDERLCELFLNSLAACYDPHTLYLRPSLAASYRTGVIRPYPLGLGCRESRGEFVIVSMHPSLSDPAAARELIGWHLLAIRGMDGPTYDLVEADALDFSNLIRDGALAGDTEVILELMNPVTLERKSMTWVRCTAF